jgi:hypothetical protein
MQKLLALAAMAAALSLAADRNTKPFLGRWNFNVTPATGKPWPQWMELVEKDGKLEGRVDRKSGG